MVSRREGAPGARKLDAIRSQDFNSAREDRQWRRLYGDELIGAKALGGAELCGGCPSGRSRGSHHRTRKIYAKNRKKNESSPMPRPNTSLAVPRSWYRTHGPVPKARVPPSNSAPPTISISSTRAARYCWSQMHSATRTTDRVRSEIFLLGITISTPSHRRSISPASKASLILRQRIFTLFSMSVWSMTLGNSVWSMTLGNISGSEVRSVFFFQVSQLFQALFPPMTGLSEEFLCRSNRLVEILEPGLSIVFNDPRVEP